MYSTRLLKLTKTAIKISNRSVEYIIIIAKILFVWQSKSETELKSHKRATFLRKRLLAELCSARTSFWPTARRGSPRRAARIHRGKINGRHFVPPTNWLQKSRPVLSWCIYTTTLEPILARISEMDERSAPPPAAAKRRPASQKNFLYNF